MLEQVQPFIIIVEFDRKKRRLKVVQTSFNQSTEEFTVFASNGTLVYSSNRPHFRRQGIKYRQPIMYIKEGHLKYQSLEVAIAQKIIDHIMLLEKKLRL